MATWQNSIDPLNACHTYGYIQRLKLLPEQSMHLQPGFHKHKHLGMILLDFANPLKLQGFSNFMYTSFSEEHKTASKAKRGCSS